MSDTLFLVDGGRALRVHPVVLLSILDHYTRRPDATSRVIGARPPRRLNPAQATAASSS